MVQRLARSSGTNRQTHIISVTFILRISTFLSIYLSIFQLTKIMSIAKRLVIIVPTNLPAKEALS